MSSPRETLRDTPSGRAIAVTEEMTALASAIGDAEHGLSMKWFLGAVLAAVILFSASSGIIQPAHAADAPTPLNCVLIDNDFDTDDMMAMPMIFGQAHVSAVIQTEGVARPEFSAAGVDALINGTNTETGNRSIPIIVGGRQNADRDLSAYQSWLPFFRAIMTRANGLLPEVPQAWAANPAYETAIANIVEPCDTVSILMLGPYTSFVNYFPLIRAKVDRIVIMGKMLGDDTGGKGKVSFNCEYDLPNCEQAMIMLQGQPAFFIDIPRLSGCRGVGQLPQSHCYAPNLEMVAGGEDSQGLVEEGLPGRLRKALLNDFDCRDLLPPGQDQTLTCSSKSTWEPVSHMKAGGGGILLWDQSAALFFLKPEVFTPYFPADPAVAGGKHFEPAVIDNSHVRTADRLRELWTSFTNDAVEVQ